MNLEPNKRIALVSSTCQLEMALRFQQTAVECRAASSTEGWECPVTCTFRLRRNGEVVTKKPSGDLSCLTMWEFRRYRATLLRVPCTRDPISLGLLFGMITPGHSMACLEWLQLGEENLSGVSGFRGIKRCIIIGLGFRFKILWTPQPQPVDLVPTAAKKL